MKTNRYNEINEILKSYGLDVLKITRIYSGKNHYCRCGCGGNYFEKTDKSFNNVLSRLNKKLKTGRDCSEEIDVEPNYQKYPMWINIPYGNPKENKCYCLYFE